MSQLVLEKLSLFETKTRFYVLATNQSDSRYRILKIDRASTGPELPLVQDPTTYTKPEIEQLLATLSAGNAGALSRVEPLFYGIAGFIKFTHTYYMILIKTRTVVGLLGGHYIYHCEEVALRAVCTTTETVVGKGGKGLSGKALLEEEKRLMGIFLAVEMGKNFYFSYTYNLTHTLQHNLTSPPLPTSSVVDSFATLNDKFLWNRHLLEPAFDSETGETGSDWPQLVGETGERTAPTQGDIGVGRKNPWLLPMIYGFVDQAKLSVFGRTIYITLIARRSRHFAGARFLKRGVNEQGYVANDVETEQIVSEALTTPFYMPSSAPSPSPTNVPPAVLAPSAAVSVTTPSQPASPTLATSFRSSELDPAPSEAPAPTFVSGTTRENEGERRTSGRKPIPRYTAFVQVRGSIPLYWNQDTVNMVPKPPIELTRVDPYFSAAGLHFDDLFRRYGGPITVLNLIKQKERTPRESKLLKEFKECIDYLNQFLGAATEEKIRYIPWDIAAANKQRDKDVIGILEDIAEVALESTKFFHSGAEPSSFLINTGADSEPYRSTPLLQSGVTRTNCIDCLDRTNAAQFVITKAALGHQLYALGILPHPSLPFDSDAVNLITEMFHDHGDTVALQYGGSHLVNTMQTYRKIGMWTSHSRDMIENLKRFYNNSFVDADKQAAIDLFLGVDPLVPSPAPARRSYREPFTAPSPESLSDLFAAKGRLQRAVQEEEGNFWFSYYRPRLFTEFARHFAFKVNSTTKYTLSSGEEGLDHSPFVPRLGTRAPLPPNSAQKRRVPSSTLPSSLPTATVSPQTPSNPLSSLVASLLHPLVHPREATEYNSYIDQFSQLSLSQDLSEKDEILYRASALIGTGEGGLQVDVGSRGLYDEVVALAGGGRA